MTQAAFLNYLNNMNAGLPGGPMGAGGLPQQGGMPVAGQPMGGQGMPQMPPGMQPPPPGSAGPGPSTQPGQGLRPPGGQPPGGGFGGNLGASLGPQAPQPPQAQQGNQMSARDQAMLGLYGELGALQPEQAKIKRQRALADQLRSGAGAKMPQMRDPTVASHPLEFLSTLAHQGAGAYHQYKADEAEQGPEGVNAREEAIYKRLADKYRSPQG